ncbi:MAG: MFS transporter [Epsilonproteobacteria bacterium]|nr:MFS transporter [Campylobacterota bacterium]
MTSRFFNISAFFFFYFSIVGVWVIFLPKMLQNIGYSATEIGIIFSIPPLMRFLTPFFFLKLFSLTQKVLHITLVMMLLSIPLLYITINDFILFALTNIFFGISFGLVLPYMETYSLSVLKKERYGKSRLWGSIGFTLVALVLARFFDNEIGLHFIAVSVIISALFAYIISLDDGHFDNKKEKQREAFSLTSHIPLWISIFFMQVSFGAFYSFFTIYETDHGISLETVSYLWAFGVLCEIILFYYQAYVIKFDLLKIIKFTVFITAVRWIMLYLFPESLLISYISQSFHAFSFALYHTATLSFLYTLYSNKKLASQFYYGFGFGLGGFAGSLIAGQFYGEYLFLSAGVIAFISLLFLYFKSNHIKV